MTTRDALAILNAPDEALPALLERATETRRRHFGDRATLCSIVNAKSGRCGEDCAFCAQASRHETGVRTYNLLSAADIRQAYDDAAGLPIEHFGVVTSGNRLSAKELDEVCRALRRPGKKAHWCASLGVLGGPELRRLREAGLKRYHHNLETAESFFPNICTTHTYADRVRTVRAAREAGLEVCSGGLFGLGESPAQRVELAMALQDLAVDAIPLNFLVPIPGTALAARGVPSPLRPQDILKTIAMFRLACPAVEIKVCAGREAHLDAMEDRIFAAGANGMMIGGYLTTRGRAVDADLDMLRRAGMTP